MDGAFGMEVVSQEIMLPFVAVVAAIFCLGGTNREKGRREREGKGEVNQRRKEMRHIFRFNLNLFVNFSNFVFSKSSKLL